MFPLFLDPMSVLHQDLNTIHPALIDTPDNEVNSQVQKLLLKMGVKPLSPYDVINHHIIPILKSETWQVKQIFSYPKFYGMICS